MSARLAAFAALAALAIAGCTPQSASGPAAPATGGKALAKACATRDGWSDTAPPARIHGKSWYVGTCGIAAVLIDAPGGLILIDAATEEAVPSILANIRSLGFDPAKIRFLLSTHEHLDHAGGLKAVQEASGAHLFARREAVRALASGEPDKNDPQYGSIPSFRGVPVARTVDDGEALKIPDIDLTAHETPAHSPGGTSWTWRSCEGGDCVTIAFVDSLSAISADGYRFSDHPERIAAVRAAHAKVAGLACDILLTPHPGQSDLHERLAGKAPLVDAGACRAYAEGAAKRFNDRLAREAAGQ